MASQIPSQILEPDQSEGRTFKETGRVQILVTDSSGSWSGRTVTLQVLSPHDGDTDNWIHTDVEWTADGINTVWIAEDLTYRLSTTTQGVQASFRRIWNHIK